MNVPVPTEGLAAGYLGAIREAVGDNRLDEALNKLQDFVFNLAPHLDDAVLSLRRRYTQYRQDRLNGVADEKTIEKITNDILEIAREAERRAAIKPSYSLYNSTSEMPAERTPLDPAPVAELQAVSAPASIAPDPVDAGPDPRNTGNSAWSIDHSDTVDEQLRGNWARYRDSRPPDDTTAVVCENIVKRYRRHQFQLDDVSFSLRVGQITGVVGRNASGKTTLLRIIVGEIAPDAGKIRYPTLTREGTGWPQIKRQIAYIKQFPEPWSGKVKTNLYFIAATRGPGEHARKLADWCIQRYGLFDYEHATYHELSGGFRTRYELVRALVSRPKLLVLDEPLASLDVSARQEFLGYLRTIAYALHEPVPIIVTSQHLYEIDAIADQMIVLEGGKCLYAGTLEKIARETDTRLYELSISLTKQTMQERLHATGMTILETVVDGYIIGAPATIPRNEVMKQLTELFMGRLWSIRDITASSRRFFVDTARKTVKK